MKEVRYIIKVTATGTEHNPNPNWRGRVNVYYYGLDKALVGRFQTAPNCEPRTPVASEILTYGYKYEGTARSAAKSWTVPPRDPNKAYWKYRVNILMYEYVDGVLNTPIILDNPTSTPDSTPTTPAIKFSTNSYNLKARLFSRKYNDIVNTPAYENSSNDCRIAYNLYHIYLRDCAEMEKATSSPTTLPPIITSPSIRCAANKMLSETDAELESIVSRMEKLTYNHKARSWEARK